MVPLFFEGQGSIRHFGSEEGGSWPDRVICTVGRIKEGVKIHFKTGTGQENKETRIEERTLVIQDARTPSGGGGSLRAFRRAG